jgi:pyruvate dehydrogenase E1 component alpha subunit
VSKKLDQAAKLEMLARMYTIRFFEQEAGRLYQKGRVKGGVHAYIGQEAVAVGVCSLLNKDDYISSTHRGHGHHIAKGADVRKLMAELLGKATGYCEGRGGSMHVAAFDVGSLGAFPIVAAGVPSAVGAALSAQLRGEATIAVAFFGEGALGQGTLHESLNLASIWNLPVIFVCEDNQYAVSTAVESTIAVRDVVALADAYGLPGEEVDGQRVLEVYTASQTAVARAREGGGPSLIKANTYRFEGHYFGEPEVYRTREEVKKARESMDPILLFKEHLTSSEDVEPEQIERITKQAEQVIQEALKYAERSPDPNPEEFANYVYA